MDQYPSEVSDCPVLTRRTKREKCTQGAEAHGCAKTTVADSLFNRVVLEKTFRKLNRKSVSKLGKADCVTTRMYRKRLRRTVNNFALWCRGHRDRRIAWIMGMVKAKLTGIRNYFNLPGNSERMKDVKVITVNSSPYAKQAYEKLGFRVDGEMQVDNGMQFVPMVYTIA